jgi:hypothetical protein
MSKIKLALAVVEDLRTLADSIETLANSMQDGEAPVITKVKEITLEDVRALLTAKKQEGKSITELLNKFGASKLTDIDPINYAAILKAAGELNG